MSVLNTIRNWFDKKNEVDSEAIKKQSALYQEYLRKDIEDSRKVFEMPSIFPESGLTRDEKRALYKSYFNTVPLMGPIVLGSTTGRATPPMTELMGTVARINDKAEAARKAAYPWKFIETGAMAGGISLKHGDKITSWADQDKSITRHREETPIFLDAVRAHNKKISAERRENKKNVVHT